VVQLEQTLPTLLADDLAQDGSELLPLRRQASLLAATTLHILLFLVLDDRIDLVKILKAGVKLLVADVRDNKVDRLAAVVVIVEVKQELSIVLGLCLDASVGGRDTQ